MFGTFKPHDVAKWLWVVSSLDFDRYGPGDGSTIARGHLIAARTSLDALIETVAAEYESGRTLSKIQAAALLNRDGNVLDQAERAPARYERCIRASGSSPPTPWDDDREIRHPNSLFCTNYATCAAGGAVPMTTGGVLGSTSRFGALLEVSFGEQWRNSRTSRFYDEETTVRQSRGSLLFRYARPGSWYVPVGGLSLIVSDTRGIYKDTEAVAPVAGRHPLASRGERWGVTGGADFRRDTAQRLQHHRPRSGNL